MEVYIIKLLALGARARVCVCVYVWIFSKRVAISIERRFHGLNLIQSSQRESD